ncbi:MAG: cytochrome c peroxidase [Caldilineaceae bacterium]
MYIMLICAVVLLAGATVDTAEAQDGVQLTPKEQLGKAIFFDENLSLNQNQACAACHAPASGWTGPDEGINTGGAVYEGSIPGRFGDRKPPSAAYATLSPVFHQDKKGLFIGGNFWDGRATGDVLGNPAADQALGPFLNPNEQALPDSACVVYRVCNPVTPGDYPVAFEEVWGEAACDIAWPGNVDAVCAAQGTTVDLSMADRTLSDRNYGNIGLSIAAYEDSPEVNAFSSKYDATFMGADKLDKLEQKGYALFRGKAKCQNCHPANGQGALFTDYTFDNLGIPLNPENPAYNANSGSVDFGLGRFLEIANYPVNFYLAERGKHKVPTLRNVDLRPDESFVKAYSHNGYFKTLEGIVNFYNTRDVKPVCPGPYTEAEALAAGCWPAPEVAANINRDELGNLGLTPDEEAAIVAFLKTLSDGHFDPMAIAVEGTASAAAAPSEMQHFFLPVIHH